MSSLQALSPIKPVSSILPQDYSSNKESCFKTHDCGSEFEREVTSEETSNQNENIDDEPPEGEARAGKVELFHRLFIPSLLIRVGNRLQTL